MKDLKSMIGAAAVVSVLALGGCKEETTPQKPAGTPSGIPATQPAGQGATIGAKGDEHTGPRHELGTQTIGGHSVKAARFGDLKPGAEAIVELKVTGGTGKPKAVRAWIGTEGGEGSAKTRGEAEGDDYDLHIELPQTLPAGSKLWVEIETDAGKPKASFDLK